MHDYPSALPVRLAVSGAPAVIAFAGLIYAAATNSGSVAMYSLGLFLTSICLFLQPFPFSRNSKLTHSERQSLSLASGNVLLALSLGGVALLLGGGFLQLLHRGA